MAAAQGTADTVARKSVTQSEAEMRHVLTYTVAVLERHRAVLDLLARHLVCERKVNGKN